MPYGKFSVEAPFSTTEEQLKVIDSISKGFLKGCNSQVLLGVTGSGKTYVMAKIIERLNIPTLVLSHNKTLAAQLYQELREFLPYNAVEYFVSYYDYYLPEAYIPQTDTYIDKEVVRNEELDKLRIRATKSLLERNDVVVVSSVSSIYGLGEPSHFKSLLLFFSVGEEVSLDDASFSLVRMQYERAAYDLYPGSFRVRGDLLEIFPVYDDRGVRIAFFGDEVEDISIFEVVSGKVVTRLEKVAIYPCSHYVVGQATMDRAIKSIELELEERLKFFKAQGKILEYQRLKERTRNDLAMLREKGSCKGIENYSRHLTGRAPGEPPPTLLDYFPSDFLVIVDESHQTIPQLVGMYKGDRSRKNILVEYGFRLPSALDNRPLRFEEFMDKISKILFVSATPGPYELKNAEKVTELLVRPTGIPDPKVEVKPAKGQVDDLIGEIKNTLLKGFRVLVTTLTKRMAEDLTEYLKDLGIKVAYLHSDIDTLDRVEILRDFRLGKYEVVVGINLLREGLDLPEVGLVAILDADQEGFLRSTTAIIQTAGRAARNPQGRVILYADKITKALKEALVEMERRRKYQLEYNSKHGIVPRAIEKSVRKNVAVLSVQEEKKVEIVQDEGLDREAIYRKMIEAAENLEFELAAVYRDMLYKKVQQ